MDEVKNDKNDKGYTSLYYTWLACATIIVCAFSLATFYGLIEPVEDAKLSAREMVAVGSVFGGVCACMCLNVLIRQTNIHPKAQLAIRYLADILMFGFLLVAIDIIKDDSKDMTDALIILAIGIAFIIAYAYIVFVYKDGKYEKMLTDKAEASNERNKLKRATKQKEILTNTANGIVNLGFNERTYDKITLRVHVRSTILGFSGLLLILCILMGAGHADSSPDTRSLVMVIGFFIGIIFYNMFIYSEIEGAVCKGGIRYEDGVRYVLLSMSMFALAMLFISSLIPGLNGVGEPNSFSGYWEFWDYVMCAVTYFLFFAITFICSTMFRKHNGHMLAFFDTDGHERRMQNVLDLDNNDKGDE